MKKLFAFLYLMHFVVVADAQNMVQNAGFENYSTCPTGISQIVNATNWFQGNTATSDYFNGCTTVANADVPTNFIGYQQPFGSGNAYAGSILYMPTSSWSEYLRGTLTALTPGNYYEVTLRVSLANGSKFAISGIGVFFYQNGMPVPTTVSSHLAVTPQVNYSSYGFITDTANWVTIVDTFLADSAYTKFIIGNFTAYTSTPNITVGTSGVYAYYYYDSIMVRPAVPPVLNMVTSQTNISCNGANTGTATAYGTGGTQPYTYLWQPGNQTTATISNLAPGTYTCTVTDAVNATVTQTITIVQPTTAVTASITNFQQPLCGFNNGSATVTASGGTPGYTYQWLPTGGTGATAYNIGAGTYTVTVTDALGCIANATVTLTQAPALTASAGTITPATCGNQNGSGSVTVSGGTPPYIYQWLPYGGSNSSSTTLGGGSFTVNIADANNCLTTVTILVPQTIAFTVSTSVTNVSCSGQNNGTATVTTTGGQTPFTYLWSNNQTTQTATNLGPGTYSVTVTDANGCTGSATITITQPPPFNAALSSVTHVGCYGQSSGTIIVIASGGTPGYTYLWNTGPTTAAIAGVPAGNYTCLVTDANGCSGTVSINVLQPSQLNLTVTNVTNTLCSQSNGTATVSASGGTPGYTYSWAPTGGTGTTASGLSPGAYTITVTDTKGCTATATATVTTSTPLNVSMSAVTNVSCNGGNNGTATATVSGGTQPYIYAWSNSQSSATANGLIAGIYSVTVTDANGCAGTATVNITQPPVLNASIGSITNVNCNGQNNGSAVVTVAGGTPGYNYQWLPSGGSGTTASSLLAGIYTVTVTDSKGCTDTAQATIVQPTQLNVSISSADATCAQNNGWASAVVSGGTTPYIYSWNTSQSTANISNLGAGAYVVNVTDAHNCTGSASVTITQSAALALTIAATNITCNGLVNGVATVSVSTGVLPYTYNWSTGGTNATVSSLAVGTYTIAVTDNTGCQGTNTVTISEPAILAASIINSTDLLCNGIPTGTAEAAATGGTVPYTYQWSNGGSGSIQNNITAGNYMVVVADSNGCTDTGYVSITEPPALNVTTQTLTNSCAGQEQGSVSATVSGGVVPYTYTWNTNPQQLTSTATGLAPGNYTVTIVDNNNCTATATASVAPYALPGVNAGMDTIICAGKDTVHLQATGAATYVWSPATGLSCTSCANPLATPAATITYQLTGTDVNGCVNTDEITIGVLVKGPVEVGNDKEICIGESAELHAEGGFEYYWYPTDNMINPQGANPVVMPQVTTTYYAVIRQSECFVDTLGQTITVYTMPEVSLGPDRREIAGNTITLHADTSNATSLTWSPPLNLSCVDCTDPDVLIEKDIRYIVTVNNGPCQSVDDIFITVSCDKGLVICPNTFTPNGDGNNDMFYPQADSRISIAHMAVYDRWGEKIFERSNFFTNTPRDGWDGTYKGKDCVPEVYSYFIQFYCGNGQKMMVKGDINIVK